ncbi:MAG TPA: PQQ-binding-like beta-propeller repeat protein [Chthoniobacteraceae bacterium]|nr:PQQ-binding-like beta-propeller repeat protein [Chthoniobacteraceae bacterium]
MDSLKAPFPKAPRWWLLGVIVGLLALCLVAIWVRPATQRQEQVIKTAGAVVIGLFLALLWLLVFSRLPWRLRLAVAALFIALLCAPLALFRFRGFSGDLVPLVSPRWKPISLPKTASPQDQRLPESWRGFPQFLGPARDGIIPGRPLARDWHAQPPQLLWRLPTGEGYAAFAIGGTKAISLEQHGEKEIVVCRDLFTGATLWTHEDTARFDNSLGGIGPRTTPAISGEHLFALGATGHLRCLELATGRLRWQRDILQDAGAKQPEWGVAGSPLVEGDLVIVHPGGPGHSLAAYRASNGEPAWSGGDARAGYSSPQLVTLLGEPQFLIFNHDAVAGHAVADGRVLWSYRWTNAAQHVTDPRVVAANRFLVSTGYGAGADLVELSRDSQNAWSTHRLWHSQRLKSKFASLILHEGFIYGLDDGRVTCIDLANGEPRWKGERIGHGQLLLAGDLLLATAENGEVLLFEARSDAAQELGRFSALDGKMWNPPALAPPFLIVRTEHEAACYRLPLAGGSR